MTPRRVAIHAGCILLCALLAATGPVDAVLDEAASVGDIERLEQAVFGPDDAPESEMRRRVAWTLLATGRDQAALRQFARLAGREPDAGGPKVGYALAAARLGDLTNAARAMRRVLRVDPDALAAVPMDESMRSRMETLRTHYMKRLARFDHDRDGAVMLAAVCYLLGEPDSARYAIGYLMANGERGASTGNLDRLVRDLANPPADSEQIAEVVTGQTTAPATAQATEQATEPAIGEVVEDVGFKLVYRDEPETLPDTGVEPVPARVTATAAAPNVGDPWAPESADTLNVPAPAPKPVRADEVPERYRIDYDKLHEDLTGVGGALDTFTQKLIRNIAAAQAKK